MTDTTKTWLPYKKCEDCGKPGVQIIHSGPLTKNKTKELCLKCFDIRKEEKK